MALVSVPGLLIPSQSISITQSNTLILDTNAEIASFIVQVPKTGNIDTIKFRIGNVDATGASLTVEGSLQTIGATGDPAGTGSLYGGSAVGTVVIAKGSDNSAQTITLGTAASATIGDWIAVCFTINPFNASDTVTIQSGLAGGFQPTRPYADHYAGAPAWGKLSRIPIVALRYDDTYYYPIVGAEPFDSGIAATAYNTGSAADEFGLRFTLAAPARLVGLIWTGGCAAGADFTCHLYNGGAVTDKTPAISTGTQDGDFGIASVTYWNTILFATTHDIAAGETHRISVRATTANSVTLYVASASAAGVLAACTAGAGSWYLSTRDEGTTSNWTDTNTSIPLILPIFSQIGDDAGGGGLMRASMSGGIL